MAIIDPEGLFDGERLASCSDLAQLYWPRFFLAANGYARLELSYKSIISKIFGNFQNPPESSKIWEIFREYEANFLAVLYESKGVWWCQFDTSEKFLPRYKTRRDEESPAPTLETMENFRKGYLEWKSRNSFSNQSFHKSPENFVRRGVGVGVGVGEIQEPGNTANRSISSVALEKPSAPASPAVFTLPCNGGRLHEVTEADFAGYAELYPAVDVMQELRAMKGWLHSDPRRAKTPGAGVKRFIANWLNKAQNQNGARHANAKLNRAEQRELNGAAVILRANLSDSPEAAGHPVLDLALDDGPGL